MQGGSGRGGRRNNFTPQVGNPRKTVWRAEDRRQGRASSRSDEEGTRAFKVGESVHAKRLGFDQSGVDAHAVFEGAELLKILPRFQYATWERHVAIKCGAAISVEADVMVVRTGATRDDRSAEIERTSGSTVGTDGKRNFDDLGSLKLERIRDFGRECGNADFGFVERRESDTQYSRIDSRKIALQYDDDVVAARGIGHSKCGLDSVGSGGKRRVGKHCLATDGTDRIGDGSVAAGDEHGTDIGLDTAAPDMHDHRLASDFGERLAGQSR